MPPQAHHQWGPSHRAPCAKGDLAGVPPLANEGTWQVCRRLSAPTTVMMHFFFKKGAMVCGCARLAVTGSKLVIYTISSEGWEGGDR